MADIYITPDDRLQKIFDGVAPGTAIHLSPGVYRQKAVIRTPDLTLVGGHLRGQLPAKRNVITIHGYVINQIGVDFAISVPIVNSHETTGNIQTIADVPGTLEYLPLGAGVGFDTEGHISTRDVKLSGARVNNNQIVTSELQAHLGQCETDEGGGDSPDNLIHQAVPPLRRLFFQGGDLGI